uniref:HTH CENPB-type domain-containing protein n=1 Tax=Ditylenchus dipsaci TaxID=166011 RepID=A0A915DXR4_9BILA
MIKSELDTFECGSGVDIEQRTSESKASRKRKSYSIKTKLEVVDYAKEYSKNAASRKFNISRSIVQSWVKQEKELQEYHDSSPGTSAKQRLQGAGRHLCFAELDKELANWLQEQQAKDIQISRKILKQQAEKIFVRQNNNNGIQFKASEGWLQKFMFRHNLCTRDLTLAPVNTTAAVPTHNTAKVQKPAEEYEQILFDFIKEQILYKENTVF